jgi:hypothetical protein
MTLLKKIAAIQIERTEDGKQRFGLISELPRGARVSVCGQGFNARTVKVQCNGQYYFVFMQDIEQAEGFATDREDLFLLNNFADLHQK